jgi:hypothetical protein
MRSSGPLHPTRADGSTLDATFELSSVPVYEIVYHHKAGRRGTPRAVNSDYHEGLELLLERLGSIGAMILGVSVDSSVARELSEADPELDLPFPLRVDRRTDIRELRLDITRAMKPVARRPGAKPDGGNDQKRIRLTVTLDRHHGFDRLRDALVGRSS